MRMTEEVPKISNSKMTHVGIVKKNTQILQKL